MSLRLNCEIGCCRDRRNSRSDPPCQYSAGDGRPSCGPFRRRVLSEVDPMHLEPREVHGGFAQGEGPAWPPHECEDHESRQPRVGGPSEYRVVFAHLLISIQK